MNSTVIFYNLVTFSVSSIHFELTFFSCFIFIMRGIFMVHIVKLIALQEVIKGRDLIALSCDIKSSEYKNKFIQFKVKGIKWKIL